MARLRQRKKEVANELGIYLYTIDFLKHVLTDRCNLGCKHCYKKRIDQVIAFAKKYGNVKINCVFQERNLDEIIGLAPCLQDDGLKSTLLVENFITPEEFEHDEKLFNNIAIEIITLPVKKKFQCREYQWLKTMEELLAKFPGHHFSVCERHVDNYFERTNRDMKCQNIKSNRICMGLNGSFFFCEHIGVVIGHVIEITQEDVFQLKNFLRSKELLETEVLNICKRCCESR